MARVEQTSDIQSEVQGHESFIEQIMEEPSAPSPNNDKMQSSSTIIFSIANTMMGPIVLLLPLKFAEVGILTSFGVAFIIGLVSYRTCNITHLHARHDEVDYITSVNRILGKVWMYVYFLNSLIILWMAGMIFFLSLCDVTYSCLQMIFNQGWPNEDNITFGSFSYQYIGVAVMVVIGWLFFLPTLGKILDLTEKGIYSIITQSIFLIYLGFKSIISGTIKFAFHADDPTQVVSLTTSKSLAYAIGVFAMAFSIHNSIVAIVRKSRNPSKNSRDVGFAYGLTFIVYCLTGFFGALGLYTQTSINPNTVLSNTLYDRKEIATVILLIITQIMAAFQLVTVLPVLNNIVRNQFFIMMWGENVAPPRSALVLFNMVYITSLLLVQIWDISPNTVMSYSGAIIGFVIMYLVPISIHLKSVRAKQVSTKQEYVSLNDDRENGSQSTLPEIPDFLKNKRSVNYPIEYAAHGGIMAIGFYIFVSQLISMFSCLMYFIEKTK